MVKWKGFRGFGAVMAGAAVCGSLSVLPSAVASGVTQSVQATDVGSPVPFGDAGFFGAPPASHLNAPIVAMAATGDGKGYWLVASDGGVFAFGDAPFLGSTGGTHLNAPIAAFAATSDSGGYWLVASDGGVFAFGDARFFGSMGGHRLNAAVVGMAARPNSQGYWLVASDGGIFSFGDAPFLGSMGGQRLNAPVAAMATTGDGQGYWLVASDGGVFAFGDAPFLGSMGSLRLNAAVTAMAARPGHHRGYWLVGADGGVFAFGDAPFLGSMGGQRVGNPVTAMVATPSGGGYWLLSSTPPPPPGWANPGTVIFNLLTAPGSPYSPGQRVVALTFDDGPSPTFTPQILQILTARHVPASFQVVGAEGAAHPDLLRQELADGMTLTNHTWDHVNLTTLGPAGWATEVDQTTNLLTGVTHHPVRCLRPPYGATNAAVVAQLGRRGLTELMWDVDPSDYRRPGTSVIVQRVLSALHPGAIVGMHDGGGDRSQTVAALPSIINGIQAAGYTIVPICS